MAEFEYRVVPAPKQAPRRGARTVPERFGLALAEAMNAMAKDGWEYVRAEALPCEERQGLTGRTTVYQNMLVFRRKVETVEAFFEAPEIVMPNLAVVQGGIQGSLTPPGALAARMVEAKPLDPVSDEGVLSLLKARKAQRDREAVALAIVQEESETE